MSEEFKALLDDFVVTRDMSDDLAGYARERNALLDYVRQLEARQITPEMQALWDEYAALEDDDYLYHAERMKGRLWAAFEKKMGG
jgi:hypothetical protein